MHLASVPPVTMNLFGTPVITWRGRAAGAVRQLEVKSRFQSNHGWERRTFCFLGSVRLIRGVSACIRRNSR